MLLANQSFTESSILLEVSHLNLEAQRSTMLSSRSLNREDSIAYYHSTLNGKV